MNTVNKPFAEETRASNKYNADKCKVYVYVVTEGKADTSKKIHNRRKKHPIFKRYSQEKCAMNKTCEEGESGVEPDNQTKKIVRIKLINNRLRERIN